MEVTVLCLAPEHSSSSVNHTLRRWWVNYRNSERRSPEDWVSVTFRMIKTEITTDSWQTESDHTNVFYLVCSVLNYTVLWSLERMLMLRSQEISHTNHISSFSWKLKALAALSPTFSPWWQSTKAGSCCLPSFDTVWILHLRPADFTHSC